MWPILIVSIIGVAVVLERVFWWGGRWMRRDPKRIEKVFTAIETGDELEARIGDWPPLRNRVRNATR